MDETHTVIMGENLVFDASVKVGSHHYARLFSKDFNVLWLSLPWNLFLYLRYGKKGERYQQWNNGSLRETENISVWSPFTLFPYRDNFGFRSLKNIARTLKYTIPGLKKILKKAGFEKCDILWLTDPRMMYLTELVTYKVLVYRCVDDLSHFSGIPQNILEAEKQLVKKSDVVFATAETLKKRLETYGKEIHDLPNAVDYEYFTNYPAIHTSFSLEYFEKIVLYVGTIGEWFDLDFVAYCAKKRPNYTFILLGPVRTNAGILSNLDNVMMPGAVPYHEVPAYMKMSDVGIIPFKMNELVNAVNPLKIYEYFASGLPVLASKAYELQKMNSPALLYETYEEGLSFLDHLMKEGKQDIRQYLKFAEKNSWQARYEKIMSILEPFLKDSI